VDVGPGAPGRASVGRLLVSPNPFAGTCDVRWAAGLGPATAAPPTGPLDLFDLAGRRVARVASIAPGAWRWQPGAGTRSGVYFARLANGRRATLVLR